MATTPLSYRPSQFQVKYQIKPLFSEKTGPKIRLPEKELIWKRTAF